MKYRLFALLVTLAPTALAQTPRRPSEADITAYFTHHGVLLQQVKALLPKIPASYDSPGITHAEVSERAASVAKENLPRLVALLAEMNAVPDLPSTGDPDRDAGIRMMDTESLRMAETTKSMLETIIDQHEAYLAHDEARIDKDVRQISLYSVDLQRSESALIRAYKSEPGPSAQRIATEGVALVADGLGVLPQFQTGLMSAEKSSEALSTIAKALREQAQLIRQDFATTSGNDGANESASIHAARLDFPAALDRAAAEFEIASFQLSTSTFGYKEAEMLARNPHVTGIGGTYYAAWPG